MGEYRQKDKEQRGVIDKLIRYLEDFDSNQDRSVASKEKRILRTNE